MKYTKFDKNTLQALRNELNKVLSSYGLESNLNIEVGNMLFSDSEVEIKVKATIEGAKTFSDVVLESVMHARGLVKEKNGRRLVRYDSKKHRYPFIYENINQPGKFFKCDSALAKFYFGA